MRIFTIELKNFKNFSVFAVALTLVVMATGSLHTFEANAGELFVVNQGPCLVYRDKLNSRTLIRVTDVTFNVDLATCVKIIGSLSWGYRDDNSGFAYGLHQGSNRNSHIAISASVNHPDDYSAWVKDVEDTKWSKWAENWWDPVVTIQ